MENQFDRHTYIENPPEISFELQKIFRQRTVGTVFDIGACEAEDSIRYARFFPNARIYAFEPRKDNCERARANISRYEAHNIVLENVALSDQIGEADFYLSAGTPENIVSENEWDFGNKSSSLLKPTEVLSRHASWLKFSEPIKVTTTTLAKYLHDKAIELIDFAHIDVQGAELLVLQGAGDRIKDIKVVWLEVEEVPFYKSQPLSSDIRQFMNSHGFINILDTVKDLQGDQLYINQRFYSGIQQKALLFKIKINRMKKDLLAILAGYFRKLTNAR